MVDVNTKTSLLHELAKPRQIGSAQYYKVISLISDKLKEAKLNVFHDTFESETVIGKHNFTNIIGIRNLNASSFIVLAAHYDSKKIKPSTDGKLFSGASDAAASCTILLALALAIPHFHHLSPKMGIIFIFFDGEEAFKEWSVDDSLYGSRHLAGLFSNQKRKIMPTELGLVEYFPASIRMEEETEAFSVPSISLFVLLDLIGSADSRSVRSFFRNTEREFTDFVRITDLVLPFLSIEKTKKDEKIMEMKIAPAQIEDDHIPFQQKGVPILHMIPFPFPEHWHTLNDTIKNLDNFSMYHWTISLYLFILAKDQN